ncbi:unnamed protein product [Absidia cylindrospora]
MHDIQQHGPRSRSRSSLIKSNSFLQCDNGGMAPLPCPPSRPNQRASPTSIHDSRKLSMVSSNTIGQDRPDVGSMWQQLMVGVNSAAGTTTAVISAESIKCIKYCIRWVEYAMRHIEQQMDVLRTLLASLASSPSSSTSTCVLSTVKKDVVDTLRKVVDIISKYAGSSLPYRAKMAVRGFILDLPSRWASLNDLQSSTNSPMLSTTTKSDQNRREHEETTLRLLNLGQESVDMLQSISGVFYSTVQRAETWLDRLYLRQQPGKNPRDGMCHRLTPIHTTPYDSVKQ